MADIRLNARASSGGVGRANPATLRTVDGTRDGALFAADWMQALAMEGRIFYATPGAALNTVSTGAAQTSFSATNPDFTLEVPLGTTALLLRAQLTQAGTVAGGAVTVIMAYQGAAERSSAGTVFTNILSTRTDQPYAHLCTPYVAPTVATDTIGVAFFRTILTQSVTTGRTGGWASDIDFQPNIDGTPIYLVGPAAFKVYSFAGSTAPSWYCQLGWAEVPSTSVQ